MFTSSKTKELQGLLKWKTISGMISRSWGSAQCLSVKMTISRLVKLFSSRNFKVWSQHATKINKQDPDGAMLTALTNVFGREERGDHDPIGEAFVGSSTVAKKLEKAQFNKEAYTKYILDRVMTY
ncbi:hypothetical protein GQ600_22899 [Phytophthora cactorum]|nr:hypothetical protein GQ600_22899 [Phytophthora cactorum]